MPRRAYRVLVSILFIAVLLLAVLLSLMDSSFPAAQVAGYPGAGEGATATSGPYPGPNTRGPVNPPMAPAYNSPTPFNATPHYLPVGQARRLTWDGSVTYQNIGITNTRVQVLFYPEGETDPLRYDPLNGVELAPGAGRSLFLGGLTGLKAGTQGNIVFMAKEPLALNSARFRRFPIPFTMKMLYHGFTAADGDDEFIIPTVLYNKYGRTTVFSIQNLEAESIQVTIQFYDADDEGSLASEVEHIIPANSSLQIDMDNWEETGLTYLEGSTQVAYNVFNGTAIISAEKVADGQPADIVAAASEYFVSRPVAADFEGVPAGDASGTYYMAAAMCEKYDLDTYYAVTNVGSTATTVKINYYEKDGTLAGSETTGSLSTGEKASIHTCNATDSDFTGSAVIIAQTQGAQIVVLGKTQQQEEPENPDLKKDFFTIFRGEPAGSSTLAFPFVRWANDDQWAEPSNLGRYQRSYLAVRNLELTTIDVDVEYYDKEGELCSTETLSISNKGKENSTAESAGALGGVGNCSDFTSGSFGYYTDGSFGGAVLVKADSNNPNAKFIAIIRAQHSPVGQSTVGEDVNGIPVP